MDDIGARRLIGAILKQAYDDYTNTEQCPPWCEYDCADRHIDKEHCDAKEFLHSVWSVTLCEGLDLEYGKYVEVAMDRCRLSKHTINYIEGELRAYKATKRELEQMRDQIITAAPIKQEGKGYDISDPTYQKAKSLLTNKKINRAHKIVDAIKYVYNRCDSKKQQLIEQYWFERRYTQEGIAYRLGVDRRTINRWKRQIVYSVAVKLGFL